MNGGAADELPHACGPCKPRGAADGPLHERIAVHRRVLRQLELEWAPPPDNVPAVDRHGVEARRGDGDEGGLVGAQGGA